MLGRVLERFRGEVLGWPERRTGSLFPGRSGAKRLTARQANTRFQHWRAAAGLRPELTIHSFRAGFATALHEDTSDVILVSRALGHRDLRPTLRYVDPCSRRLREAIESSFGGVV